MTFFTLLEQQLSAAQQLELLLRIVVAAICGALVGMERSRRLKDAGLRTHCMVAFTAAVLMIISKYGFGDLASVAGVKEADGARIAAQIVSGISFLGAGIIYRDRHANTKGLTTAAGIWAVAGIGMAIGAGLYYIGLFATAFVLLLQILLHRHNNGNDHITAAELSITMDNEPQAIQFVFDRLEQWKATIVESHLTRKTPRTVCYQFTLRLKADITHQQIAQMQNEIEGIHDISFSKE